METACPEGDGFNRHLIRHQRLDDYDNAPEPNFSTGSSTSASFSGSSSSSIRDTAPPRSSSTRFRRRGPRAGHRDGVLRAGGGLGQDAAGVVAGVGGDQ